MARDDGTQNEKSQQRETEIDRRSYLKAAGATSTAVLGAGIGTSVAGAVTDNGIEFQRTVNVVDDLGVDPTGTEPVDSKIASAITPGTKLVFPDGEYLFAQRNRIYHDTGNVGFVGEGDVTFTVSEGFNEYFLVLYADKILFRDIDVDIDKPDTTTGFKPIGTTRVHVENVEYFGRGNHSTDGYVASAIMPVVTDPDGTGVVKNLVAKKGSAWGHYKNGEGRIGVWVGRKTKGTIKLIDLDLREFGNNAIYASRTRGNVQVEGGYFLNNNAGSVRISGDGSYVDGATIEIDPDKYTGPQTRTDSQWYFDGVRIEQGNLGPEYKPAGVEIRNCEITVRNMPSGTSARPVAIWETARTVRIENTNIRTDESTPAIFQRAHGTQTGGYDPSDGARWVRMDNVNIVGDAQDGSAILLRDAPNSTLVNSCINQNASGRDGVRMVNCDGSTVADSTIEVAGTAIDFVESSGTETTNISSTGACDLSSGGQTSDDQTSDDQTSDDQTTTEQQTKLVIDGQNTSGVSEYTFSVTGSVEKDSSSGSIDSEDVISGSTVQGAVANGRDAYLYTGDISGFQLDGDATVYRDGTQVDPASLGSDDGTTDGSTDGSGSDSGSDSSSTELPNTLVVDGSTNGNDVTTYSFSVTGDVEKSAGLGSVNAYDTVNGSEVNGRVIGGRDGFRFSGEVTNLTFDGSASIEFDDADG